MLGINTTNKLSVKLALPATIIIAVVTCIVGFLVAQLLINRYEHEANTERDLKVQALTTELATTRLAMLDRVREAVRISQNEVSGRKVTVASSVQAGERSVPNLLLDNVSLVNNKAFVENLFDHTGANISFFVRDADNHFVCVASNVKRADNGSAVGEMLEPDSAAARDLSGGRVAYGSGFAVADKSDSRPVVRGFELMKDAGGRVVGAYSVSFYVSIFGDFSREVADQKILTNGFLAVIDKNGNNIAKSSTAPDALVDKLIATPNLGKEAKMVDDWSVTRHDLDDWGYSILSGYSRSDPTIGQEYSNIITWTVLAALNISVLLGGLIVFIAVSITARLDEAVDVAEKLAVGDLNVDLQVNSNDEVGRLQDSMLKILAYLRETAETADRIAAGELGVQVKPLSKRDRMGNALKNMLDKLLNLVQSQGERDALQSSIMKLLNEVADVAQGDLTAEAEVTADATGAIADAFNYMIDELREIVRQVKNTSSQVGAGADEIRATTDRLAEGSAAQARQISLTSTAVDQIAASIAEVSASAAQSSEVAENALQTAQNGARAVNNNIAAMTRIRTQVQDTAKRIKKLGERSQEIDEIVGIIDELADRTSILALNASLQAAAAGEAGRGFATVAEEVERLADRSTIATQRIANLTRTIQSETKDVVASMEDTIREVVDGSQLANEAGNSLQEIEQVSNDLARLLQIISQTSRRQAQSSEEISRSMSEISQITDLVSTESRQTAGSVKGLVSLTDKLRGSVATFKLPENKTNANGNGNGHDYKVGVTSGSNYTVAAGKPEITLN